MKINATDHLDQLTKTAPSWPQNAEVQTGRDFARILEEHQTPAAGSRPAGGPAGAAALMTDNALTGMILAGRGLQEVGDKGVQTQLERTLDQMDQYAAALGDDRRTLKDVAPLAEGLGQAAGQLSRLSQGLKEGNPLKGLSNEAAVAATVEYMKFQRGDYVA